MKTIYAGLLITIFFFIGTGVFARFYKYADDKGMLHFVDDMTKIPLKYQDQVKIYKERFDDLPEDVRKEKIKKEREKEETEEKLRDQKFMEMMNRWKKESEEHLAGKRSKIRQTPVKIINNQILVPVKIGYGKKEVETWLLLDTGASIVTIHKKLADSLHIKKRRRIKARVAGGKKIKALIARVDYVEVGPYVKKNIKVGIYDFEGSPSDHTGLLGINFLKGLNYSIDFDRSVITWEK